MSTTSSPQNEIRELADAMFDGVIDQRGVDRLNELIVNHPSCRVAYLELINLHGELFCQANFHSDEQAALSVLRDFSQSCERQERRTRRREMMFMVASVLVVCGLFSWFFVARLFQPAALGSVAFLTSNASLRSGELELGHVLHTGKTLSIDEGVISVQLPHVLLDLIGPAQLKLDAKGQVQLQQGTLTARVQPGGEGFKVITPDAEVVDLGTEFLVKYEAGQGTQVSVRRGRAQVSLLNTQRQPTKTLELTASRAAQIKQENNTFKEIDFQTESFHFIDKSRGGIRSLDGHLRTSVAQVPSLRSGQISTFNHLLVVPEQQEVRIDKELVLKSINGPVRIPAGSVVSSYLVHFDPGDQGSISPRGSISFFDTIAAVLGSSSELISTDSIFGLENTSYEAGAFRGLEPDQDHVWLSDDQRTISFHFGASPPQYLDQARVLVISNAP
ncbi:MAG TPA: FecR domain-containing protein [Planctomicrobium sp.]|nr:FecR domain-containing protein [Planctomicrobium sp.]